MRQESAVGTIEKDPGGRSNTRDASASNRAQKPITTIEPDRKWPVAARFLLIAGSASALWGLIWLGYRAFNG